MYQLHYWFVESTSGNASAPVVVWYNGGPGSSAGGGGISAEIAEETLLRAGVHGKTVQQAPYSGFLRMGSGRTVVIMDAGEPIYLSLHPFSV